MNSAIKIIKRLNLSARRKLVDVLSGNYLSAFKGQGIEFDDLREYVAGDSVKDIDWNATAKTGTVFIRKYIETRELKINFAVDASHSMFWGSRSDVQKIDIAVSLIYLIAQIAIRNGDRYGAELVKNGKISYIEPRKSRSHFLKIYKALKVLSPRANSLEEASEPSVNDLQLIFRNLIAYQRGKSLCFFITDLLDLENKDLLRLICAANKKHEIVIVQIFDHAELFPELLPDSQFQDSETKLINQIDFSDPNFLRQYKEEVVNYQKALHNFTLENNIDLLILNSQDDIVLQLILFLRKRQRLRNVRH